MLIISQNSVQRLIERLHETGHANDCRDELERMIQIKSALLWRADAARACIGWQLGAQLTSEITTLENALDALLRDDIETAADDLHYYLGQIAQVPI